jgi:tetratricopeptide (TPR) repeat protein
VTFRKSLGNILLSMDSAAAAREFEIVTRLDPSLAEGHPDLGLAYQALGDSTRAAAEYKRALAVAPDYLDALHYLDALPALARIDRTAGKTEARRGHPAKAGGKRRRYRPIQPPSTVSTVPLT